MARNMQHRTDNSDSYTHASAPSATHTFTFTKPGNISPTVLRDPNVTATVSFDPWGPVLNAKVSPPAPAEELAESEASSSAASEAGFSERSRVGSDARSLQGGSEGGSGRMSDLQPQAGRWTVTIQEMPRSDAMVSLLLLVLVLVLVLARGGVVSSIFGCWTLSPKETPSGYRGCCACWRSRRLTVCVQD